MNQEQLVLLEKLATKLGVTSEYLWSVLVKQAPVSSTVDLILGVVAFLVLVAAVFFAKRGLDDDEELPAILGAIATLVSFCVFVGFLCCLSNILSGFFNPEFWALNYILSHV